MRLKVVLLPLVVLLLSKSIVGAPGDVSFIVSSTETPKEHENKVTDVEETYPIIYEMNINSNVSNRFAKTLIESKVKNKESKAQEATFSVALPEKAFISEFVMVIGEKSYKAFVKDKEEAQYIYDNAVASGQSAAQVAVSARDSNRFTVSINIEAEAKAAFLLTYEELLERKNEFYELVLNIHPGQIVKDLNVQVNINESRPLVFVRVPSLRSGNEISKNDNIDPLASVEIINKTSATVHFQPDFGKQKEFAKDLGGKEAEGLSGQFIVQYEVERDPLGGEVLLQDGYFVHFFAPKDVEVLPKNVYFILDTSSSMYGSKIQHLKDAMISILGEIKPEDTLSIVEFNSDVLVWNIEAETPQQINYNNYTDPFPQLRAQEMPGPIPATKEVIEKAKKLITRMQAIGTTYIIGGLEVSLYLVKSEIERNSQNKDKKQPIIIFLTDGDPNVGIYSTTEITDVVTRLNKDGINVPIFSLSFGEGADKAFLRKLSLKNMAFSRHIYDAGDAAIQLQEFYKQISSPLLSDVNFKYDSEAKEVTRIHYPLLFRGSEIVVAGVYNGPNFDANVIGVGPSGSISLHPKVAEPVTSLERLWAYLTIKETLEKREATDDKTELTKKALDLALKYSFVTDVTSLVVVKPNATGAVDTEDASQPRPWWRQPSPVSTSGGSSGQSGPTRQQLAQTTYEASYDSIVTASTMDSKIDVRPQIVYTTLPPPPPPQSLRKIEDDLTWLASIMDHNNRTITLPQGVFELGDFQNIPAGDKCPKSPKGEEGNCTLLKDCPEVFALLTDFDVYKQFFCPMENKYAGVCCPKKNV